MTQDEIIKLAKEADLVTWLNTSKTFSSGVWWIEAHEPDDCLFKFAELVAQRERERLNDAAIKAAEKAVDVAIALEREACFYLVKDYIKETDNMEARGCLASVAYDIKARGQS